MESFKEKSVNVCILKKPVYSCLQQDEDILYRFSQWGILIKGPPFFILRYYEYINLKNIV